VVPFMCRGSIWSELTAEVTYRELITKRGAWFILIFNYNKDFKLGYSSIGLT